MNTGHHSHKKGRFRRASLLALLPSLLAFTLMGCAASGGREGRAMGREAAAPGVAAEVPGAPAFLPEDGQTAWDDTATFITLGPQGMDIQGSGASARGGDLAISQAGVYVLSGALADGQILVDAPKGDLVRLVLNGVTVTNSRGAALYASRCRKLVVTLAADTQNTFRDGGKAFAYQDLEEEEPTAALFTKNDLTLNGEGALTVQGDFRYGIAAKDNLLVAGGRITVKAADSALRGNDSVTVAGGSLTLQGGWDGIQTHNDQDPFMGWVLLAGGEVNITAGYDGVQADRAIAMIGGVVNITAGEGKEGDSHSQKGLKSRGDLKVQGGVLTIRSRDDSLHADANMEISGGEVTLSSGGDAIHADGDLVMDGGMVQITGSYEGMEAARITIRGGSLDIVSDEDGINAAGDGQGPHAIDISGGSIRVRAGGDGLDANGDITVSGGDILCLIQSSRDNGAMDCDGDFTVSGGTLLYGGSGAGRVPTGQGYVRFQVQTAQGAPLSLAQPGGILMTFTPGLPCRELIFSLPGMAKGQEYRLMEGDKTLGTAQAQEQ